MRCFPLFSFLWLQLSLWLQDGLSLVSVCQCGRRVAESAWESNVALLLLRLTRSQSHQTEWYANAHTNESPSLSLARSLMCSPLQTHRNPYSIPVPARPSRIAPRIVVSRRAPGKGLFSSLTYDSALTGVLRNSMPRAGEKSSSSGGGGIRTNARAHRSPYQQELQERWTSDKSSSSLNSATECRTTQLLSWQPVPATAEQSLELQMQIVGTSNSYNNNYRRINSGAPPTTADDKTWL